MHKNDYKLTDYSLVLLRLKRQQSKSWIQMFMHDPLETTTFIFAKIINACLILFMTSLFFTFTNVNLLTF